MITSTTPIVSYSSIPLHEIVPSTFIHKIQQIVFDTLKIFNLLFTAQFDNIKWQLDNRSHHIAKDVSLSFDSQYVLGNPEIMQKLTDYQKIAKVTSNQKAFSQLRTFLKKGYCHGECMTFLELLKTHSQANLVELTRELKNRKDRIVYWQSLELFRYTFFTKGDLKKSGENCLTPDFPSFQLNMDPKKEENNILSSFLTISNQNSQMAFIIRVWNKSSAHTVLAAFREDKEFIFYDTLAGGIYNFDSKKQLFQQMIQIFQKHLSSSDGDIKWQIEPYYI